MRNETKYQMKQDHKGKLLVSAKSYSCQTSVNRQNICDWLSIAKDLIAAGAKQSEILNAINNAQQNNEELTCLIMELDSLNIKAKTFIIEPQGTEPDKRAAYISQLLDKTTDKIIL